MTISMYIYYILKHGLLVDGCKVTIVPSGICNETKWSCNSAGGQHGDPLLEVYGRILEYSNGIVVYVKSV
jgi:hypothetical protein